MFEGYMVSWSTVSEDGRSGHRQVFETFAEAIEKARYLAPRQGVVEGGYMVQHVVMQRLVHGNCSEPCDICYEICSLHPYDEGPTCGVCDGLGHVAENCRAGDVHNYCPDWAM